MQRPRNNSDHMVCSDTGCGGGRIHAKLSLVNAGVKAVELVLSLLGAERKPLYGVHLRSVKNALY